MTPMVNTRTASPGVALAVRHVPQAVGRQPRPGHAARRKSQTSWSGTSRAPGVAGLGDGVLRVFDFLVRRGPCGESPDEAGEVVIVEVVNVLGGHVVLPFLMWF